MLGRRARLYPEVFVTGGYRGWGWWGRWNRGGSGSGGLTSRISSRLCEKIGDKWRQGRSKKRGRCM